MPRPGLQPTERRTRKRGFKVTERESQLIDEHAAAAGLRPAVYMRNLVLRHRLVAPRTPAVNLRVVPELQRLGNNLNQLVKLLHQGRAAPGLGSVLAEIHATIKTFHRDLLGLQSSRDRKAD